ncbi:MAG: NAD(P)/FAD-dependent oxidoreductase [Cyanobacteria bacterium P01_F01_bin.116]
MTIPSTQHQPTQMPPKHWAIVGGGMLGLTLAHRLAQAGQQVTLYEAAPKLGGLASAWQLGDIVWDQHYHVTLLSDLRMRGILQELGLEQDMQWEITKTGVYANGRLYSVSNAIEFLKFPPLGLLDKIRLAITILYGARITNWRRLEQIPVTQWLKRWSGKRTLNKFWKPLLRAKLGDNYRIASAAFIWATIARLYAARRNGLKEERFGYLKGGYRRLLETFGDRLKAENVEILTGVRVEQVRRSADSHQMQVVQSRSDNQGNQSIDIRQFDQVVVTTAAPIAAKICQGLHQNELAKLFNIQYQGIVCASLLLTRPLSPYYVTNITDDAPFTGVIEMTALVDQAELNGHHLIYLPKYVPAEDDTLQLSDEFIKEEFLKGLEAMYPDFQRDQVSAFQISRVKYVMALSTLNYSTQLPPVHTSVKGLHILNSAHIVNGTLNVNDTIQLAERHIESLLAEAHKDKGPELRKTSSIGL